MTKIDLDLSKTIEENAAIYFEKSKKAKKKSGGAKEALEKSRAKLKEHELKLEKEGKEKQKVREEAEEKAKKSRERKWFEKFRWFFSSEGFLCVGGRDATTNEILIKKHANPDDIVFHTELAGSPFFVVKRDSNASAAAIGEETIKEAAIATAGYSRAWKAGLQSADVYWVKPGQVSKEAKAGEYLVKGAFMIYGKKNYVPVMVVLAIGVTSDGRIMGGPAAAVAKNCAKSVKILQGDNKPSDAAKKIVKILGVDSSCLDEIIRAMPAGECKVVK